MILGGFTVSCFVIYRKSIVLSPSLLVTLCPVEPLTTEYIMIDALFKIYIFRLCIENLRMRWEMGRLIPGVGDQGKNIEWNKVK